MSNYAPLFTPAGGTLLRVFTEGVTNRSELGCVFSYQSTHATFVSSTEVHCIVPPTNSSSTQCRGEPLEVTLLTDRATKNGVSLRRVASPAILEVQPPSGYYREPQWVRLVGYGYVDSQHLSCMFYNEAGVQVLPNHTTPNDTTPHHTTPHHTTPHHTTGDTAHCFLVVRQCTEGDPLPTAPQQ